LGSKDEHVPVVTLNGAVCADVKVLQNGTYNVGFLLFICHLM